MSKSVTFLSDKFFVDLIFVVFHNFIPSGVHLNNT